MFRLATAAALLCAALPHVAQAEQLTVSGVVDFASTDPTSPMHGGLTPYIEFRLAIRFDGSEDGQKAPGYAPPLSAVDWIPAEAELEIGGHAMAVNGPSGRVVMRIIDSGSDSAPDIVGIRSAPAAIPGSPLERLTGFEYWRFVDPGFSDGGTLPTDWSLFGTAPGFVVEDDEVRVVPASGAAAGASQLVSDFSYEISD